MTAVAQFIVCPKCRAVLGPEMFGLQELRPCPSCEAPLQVDVFPAMFRQNAVANPERVMTEGEAGCFYHPEKKAAVVCDACGRFLCALCDVEFDGRHICPSCLEAGKEKGKIKKLKNQHTRHDKIAVALAVFPLLIFYLTIFTAPLALFYSIWHWNSPPSVAPSRPKVSFTIAIVLAALQITAWAAFFIYLLTK